MNTFEHDSLLMDLRFGASMIGLERILVASELKKCDI